MPKDLKETIHAEPKAKTSFSLIVVLVVVIFITVAYFLVWPEYSRLAASKNKLLSQKNLLQSQTKYSGNLQKLISNYEAVHAADKEKLAQMLPQEIDGPALFVLFEKLTQKNKMAILAMDISEKAPKEELKILGVQEIQIALNLAGGEYADFKNLLVDLESSLRLMDVVSINYTPESTSYVLNLRTYRLGGG